MAQKDIKANVILNGQVGSGFSKITKKINELGDKLNSFMNNLQEMNGWATELVGDSVKVYQSYSMA